MYNCIALRNSSPPSKHLNETVGEGDGAAVVGSGVGSGVGSRVGCGVGSGVGSGVGFGVGRAVGLAVGAGVALKVGMDVEARVGPGEGENIICCDGSLDDTIDGICDGVLLDVLEGRRVGPSDGWGLVGRLGEG